MRAFDCLMSHCSFFYIIGAQLKHFSSTHVLRPLPLSQNKKWLIILAPSPHSYSEGEIVPVNGLRASSEATSSCSSSISNLAGLKGLYECVEDFLQMKHTQHALSNGSVLDQSLGLLDICGTTRDVLLQMKQSAKDLQSSFRIRREGAFDLTNKIAEYMTSRKKINKVIRKCLGDLKRMNNKHDYPLVDEDQDLTAMVSVLREVEAITLAIFESLLSFLSMSKAGSKKSSWSLISKLMHNKRVACEGNVENTNELKKVDVALNTLIGDIQYQLEDVKNVQKPLEALETSIQDLEDGLDGVFRHLINFRVSLLNIVNK